MANKIPSFQFYPSDWRSDNGVQSLNYYERGVWFEMLCLMHESEQRGKLILNGKPMPEESLARLLSLDKQALSKTLATLIDFGVCSRDENGILYSRRMVKDETERQANAERQRRHYQKQQVEKPNGQPNDNLTAIQQKPNGVSSSSSSSSLSNTGERGIAVNPDSIIERDNLLETIRVEYGTVELPKTDRWVTIAEKAVNYSLPTSVLLTAFRAIRDDSSRKFDITPENVWEKAMLICAEKPKPTILDITKCPDCHGAGFIKIDKHNAKQCEHLSLKTLSLPA
jgi:hypothetical protein